jgi:S-formylglutathione hydrolase FrmB
MLERKIAHEYRELPGDHSWGYWDKQVQDVLKLAAQKMRVPPKVPDISKTKIRTN